MVRRTVLLLIGLFVPVAFVTFAMTPPPTARTDLLGDPLPDGALARIGTLRFRHGVAIASVAYALDGKSVAIRESDGSVCIWDAATGRQILRIPQDGVLPAQEEKSRDRLPLPMAYSADGKHLATTGRNNAVIIHDTEGRAVQSLRGLEKPVAVLAFAPDGKSVYAMDQSQAVRGWDGNGKERLKIAGRQTRGTGFALAPDGKTIATAGEDDVRLWDAVDGTELAGQPRLRAPARSVAFSPDGGTLAIGDRTGAVSLWDRRAGRMRDDFHFDRLIPVNQVAFSPDGKTLIVGSDDFILCDVASGKWLAHLPGLVAAFSPDGRTVAVGHDRILGFADARTGRPKEIHAGHTQPLRALAFAPDGKTLATSAPDRTVRLWDASTGKETTGTRGKAIHASSLAFSPNGKTLVAGAALAQTIWANYLICIWDAETGKEVPQRFEGHSEAIHRVVFAADGKAFFTGSADGDVRMKDPVTGHELRRFKEANRRVYDLAVSPDGKTLAAGGHAYIPGGEDVEGAVRLLDVATGAERMTLRTHDKAVLGVGYLRDGRTLVSLGTRESEVLFSGVRLGLGPDLLPAAASKEPIVLWELATGQPRARLLSERDRVCRLAVSPDGRLAALGCQDGSVRIWDLLAGLERRRFEGHAGPVTVLAFAPDGRVLASGSADTTVLLWDLSLLPVPAATTLGEKELAALWADLDTDPLTAYRAIGKLATAPKEAAAFLGERVRPVVPPDARKVANLLADLDNDSFDERERATTELHRLGDRAVPALRQFLNGSPAAEGSKRAKGILAELERDVVPRENLRELRAVEALEWAGATDALRKLAAGMPEARLTREAKAGLVRLDARKPGE
jgi:WD40 repeat protein